MKKILQQLLSIFGVKLVRAGYSKNRLPSANVDNIEIVVRFYAMMKQKINMLQIGACDGVTSDSLYPYIKSGDINAYLVEPSKTNFSKLSDFYKGQSNAILINVAVAEKDEIKPFYTVKDEGRWLDNGSARQIASFFKEHLLNEGIYENEIAVEDVQCNTISTIMKNHQIDQLDILLIDTEGYDGEIVKMAMNSNILPQFIAFENVQLVKNYQQQELDQLYALLSKKGYVWTHDRINTMAVRKDFLSN